MADTENIEGADVRSAPHHTRSHCGLTYDDDTTVGGEGWRFAGIGNGQLPEDQRKVGAAKRRELFPNH
jgi:hypothetical protein